MALGLASVAAVAGGITHTPIALLTLIPLIAVGVNYYRYQSVDPESKPIDQETVIKQSVHCMPNSAVAYLTLYFPLLHFS